MKSVRKQSKCLCVKWQVNGEVIPARRALSLRYRHCIPLLHKRAHLLLCSNEKTNLEVCFLSNFRTIPAVFAGVFIALTVLLTHIFSLQTPFLRISFSFLPIAIFSAIFGPWRGASMAAAADLIGCLLFSPGLYFPGFTFSAALSGFLYGRIFYRQSMSLARIAVACSLVFFIIDLALNTLWLTILYQQAAAAFFVSRLIKSTLLLPLHIILISMLYRPLIIFLPRQLRL